MSDTNLFDELEATPLPTRPGGKVKAVATAEPKRVKIILEESEAIPPTGLFMSHNGRAYMLRPGEEIDLPVEVLNVLKDAIMSVPDIDPLTRQPGAYRDRMRYPFRYV